MSNGAHVDQHGSVEKDNQEHDLISLIGSHKTSCDFWPGVEHFMTEFKSFS